MLNKRLLFEDLPQSNQEIHEKLDFLIDLITKKKEDVGDVLIDIDEAAKLMKLSRSTLYSKTSKNQIPYIKKIGSKRLWFNKDELLKWRTD